MNRLQHGSIEVRAEGMQVYGIEDKCQLCGRTWSLRSHGPLSDNFAKTWYEKKINEIKAHKALCYLKKITAYRNRKDDTDWDNVAQMEG